MKRYLVSTLSPRPPKSHFYVYTLIDPRTMEIFYVGKGKRYRYGDHMLECNLRKHTHKNNKIRQILGANQPVLVDIVFCSADEQECLQHERNLISTLKRQTDGGHLTNVTEGGDCPPPPVITDEQREARRQRWMGDANPTRGRSRTPEERAAISNTRRMRLESGEITPTAHTEAHKQQLRQCNPGGEATARAVYQIDPTTGTVIAMWKSMRGAGIELGIRNWRNISNTLVNHPNRVVAGFYWRWVDDANDVVDGVLQNIAELNTTRLVRSNAKKYIIIQRDDAGGETEWENMLVAMQHTGIHNSGISAATKSGKKYGGYYWEKRKK